MSGWSKRRTKQIENETNLADLTKGRQWDGIDRVCALCDEPLDDERPWTTDTELGRVHLTCLEYHQ